MALQQLPGTIIWPGHILESVGVGAFSAAAGATMDAAGEYAAFVFAAREAMSIAFVSFRTVTAVGSPTAIVRIETVDPATGYPTGTLWATNTSVTTTSLTANSWLYYPLTAAASVTPGEIVAVKIGYNSGTSFQIAYLSNWCASNSSLPYLVTSQGGTTATINIINTSVCMALQDINAAAYHVPRLLPANTITTDTTFNQTNAEKQGAIFQVPFKCRCIGIRAFLGANTTNINVVLMTSGGTELSSSSTAYDGNQRDILAGAGAADFYFDNPVTLVPSVSYIAAYEPTAGATNSTFHYFSVASTELMGSCPGGTNFCHAFYTSGGGWQSNLFAIPYLDLLIDQLDDGLGVGAPTLAIGL